MIRVSKQPTSEGHFPIGGQFLRPPSGTSPCPRFGEPTEIADAVLWLCSPGSSFVIGHALAVDGGITAHGRGLFIQHHTRESMQ
jgi:NAD(P)-dependent dehydrogenase (short-subunit alcohol dehydrogenase family)